MFTSDDVSQLCQLLAAENIPVWLAGGWGIDALLGEQTRPHKDLDILVLVADVIHLQDILAEHGYRFKDVWTENLPARDAQGRAVPTAFILCASDGREVDVHALRLVEQGMGIPAWQEERSLDLTGTGRIAGHTVHCLSVRAQVQSHTGYELPEAHRRDMDRLNRHTGAV